MGVYSTVCVSRKCFQAFVTLMEPVGEEAGQYNAKTSGVWGRKRIDLLRVCFGAYARQATNDYNLRSCLFNYPPRPD